MGPLAHVRAAFGYFSIFPVGNAGTLAAPTADTLVVLPLVGAFIGVLAGGLAYGVSFVAPAPLVVAVAFLAPILLCGAIHYDGFLDSCDALFATVAVSRRLDIFKDPRHGTFALVGMAIATVTSCAALASIPVDRLWIVLGLCGALARWAAVTNALFVPYARGGALGTAFTERPSIPALMIEGAILALAGTRFASGWGFVALPLALLIALGGGHRLKRRLGGGLVGDVYGYLIVCTEITLLCAFAVVFRWGL